MLNQICAPERILGDSVKRSFYSQRFTLDIKKTTAITIVLLTDNKTGNIIKLYKTAYDNKCRVVFYTDGGYIAKHITEKEYNELYSTLLRVMIHESENDPYYCYTC